MPDERSSDLPGGSDDPTRANDPVDPTRVHEPVDTSLAQGAGPAAGMGRSGRGERPFSEDPMRRQPGRDDDDRKTSTWLWALLAALLIGIVLFALLQGSDDDDAVGTVDPTTDTAAPESPVEDAVTEDTAPDTTVPEDTAPESDAATEDTVATTTTAAPEASEGAAAGAVTASDGTDLLGLVQGDSGDAERLAPYAGDDVAASSVEVLEVVDDQGIWVGTDDQQRLFVRSTDDLAVAAGETVALEGTLRANAEAGSDDAIELTDDQGAELLEQQGHHIELDQLTPA